ncbi:MAG: sulfotransferase domain-containing protein [Hormoscilla sp. GM7CHS1pb]|nr:sulfotransferase domain-containing protein [Hormoscilla sp. GM7CHS1pb]
MKTKHIAMWACPRSRSTAITRAFEQIDDCIIYDEPLYGCCFVNSFTDYDRLYYAPDYLSRYPDTNYSSIVKKLTGDLPEGKSFSFQKHMSNHLLPEFDKSWISQVKNFFLIRNPRETVLSYWQARTASGFAWEESESRVCWEEHYQLFKEIENITGEKPLVIDSGDLVKNPQKYLKVLCSKLGVKFSEKMLNWEHKKTNILSWENTTFENFSEKVINSTGILQESQEYINNIPDILEPCINKCMPFYE